MKPRLLTAILLFISGYSPLFLILAVRDFDFDTCHCFKHQHAAVALITISIISIISLYATVRLIDKGNMAVKIVSVKDRSPEIIGYTIPYIVSFFSFDLSKWGDVISLGIFLSIMLLLTIKSKSVFLNPILALWGYGLYDVEYSLNQVTRSTTVISKLEINPDDVCNLRSLSRFLYLLTNTKEGSNE